MLLRTSQNQIERSGTRGGRTHLACIKPPPIPVVDSQITNGEVAADILSCHFPTTGGGSGAPCRGAHALQVIVQIAMRRETCRSEERRVGEEGRSERMH